MFPECLTTFNGFGKIVEPVGNGFKWGAGLQCNRVFLTYGGRFFRRKSF
jgi:hypothetical protein